MTAQPSDWSWAVALRGFGYQCQKAAASGADEAVLDFELGGCATASGEGCLCSLMDYGGGWALLRLPRRGQLRLPKSRNQAIKHREHGLNAISG